MTMLFVGCYGLTSEGDMPVKPMDLCLVVSIVLFFIFRKAIIVKKAIFILCLYGALMFSIAFFQMKNCRFNSLRGAATWASFFSSYPL